MHEKKTLPHGLSWTKMSKLTKTKIRWCFRIMFFTTYIINMGWAPDKAKAQDNEESHKI